MNNKGSNDTTSSSQQEYTTCTYLNSTFTKGSPVIQGESRHRASKRKASSKSILNPSIPCSQAHSYPSQRTCTSSVGSRKVGLHIPQSAPSPPPNIAACARLMRASSCAMQSTARCQSPRCSENRPIRLCERNKQKVRRE